MLTSCYHGQRVALTLQGRAATRFPLRHRPATIVRLPGEDIERPAMSGNVLAVWDGERLARAVHTSLLREWMA